MNTLKNVLAGILVCVFLYAVAALFAPLFGWSDLGPTISIDSPIASYFFNMSTEEKAHFFFLATLLLTCIAVPTLILSSFFDAKGKRRIKSKSDDDSLTITFTLMGESVRRFRLLSDQYGGHEKLLVSALGLIDTATVATANGSAVVVLSADGSIERTLVEPVEAL